MNAWWAAALAGAVCGLLSGLGIGGGTLLMVWMTGVAALPQQTAQGINLLYFLPSAACALLFHIRNRLIRWDIVLPAALGGCVTAAIAAWIATGLDVSLLRRLFGGFLLLTGLRELFFRQQRDQERQIALEDQRGGDGVDGIFALFPVIIAVAQDLVCFDGRPSFVPEHDLHAAGNLDRGGHLAVQRRARALRAVHVARESHHEPLRAALLHKCGNGFRCLLRAAAVDDGRAADDAAARIGNGDPVRASP